MLKEVAATSSLGSRGALLWPCASMAAMPSLKIDNARYVVTVDPQRRIIQDASILIEDGRITPGGQGRRAGRRARPTA